MSAMIRMPQKRPLKHRSPSLPVFRLLTGLVLVWIATGQLGAQQQQLEKALELLPDIQFESIEPPEGFSASYELRIRQPIDHENPGEGTFLQRVFLNHRGIDSPTVMVVNGYARSDNQAYELTHYLNANEVSVEHRYFGVSMPDSLDWSFLNLEQATADLHTVRALLGEVYPGPWAASGRSKGGMTTVAYRYFYPRDVAASVPYVAPLQTSFEDERLYAFLRSAGTPECRAKHLAFQRWVLVERDQVLPRLNWYAKGKGWTFEYMGIEAAFEYAVLEYPFSFWQYGKECEEVPDTENPEEPGAIDRALDHLEDVVGFSLYSDQEIQRLGPHYYQAATQTGYYGFETADFTDLLVALPPQPHAAFVPKRFETTYDPTLSVRISDWLKAEGENFVFLYGEIDTWTGAAAEITAQTGSLKFIIPGRHHGDTSIENLSPTNREQVRVALESWLGVRLDPALWAGR